MPKGAGKRAYYYAAAAILVLAGSGRNIVPASLVSGVVLLRARDWEQLTFFTDSAVYPALSPDGRMLAFIRGTGSF